MHLEYGQYLMRSGETAAAKQQFQRASESAHKSQSPRLEAAALNELACAYRQEGEYSRAVTAQRRSLALNFSDLSADEAELSTDLGNLAADAIAAGDLQMAKQLLHCSLSLEIRSGSLTGQAADYGNLAVVSGMQGDLIAGIKLLRKALQLHRQLKDDRSVGCDLLNLAAFYESLGNLSRSLTLLVLAKQIFHEIAAADLLKQAATAAVRVERILTLQSFDPNWN